MADNKKIPINMQINAVELELANLKGHVTNIKRLAAKKQYNIELVKISEDRIPFLEAAVKSLEFLEKNQDKIKELFANKSK